MDRNQKQPGDPAEGVNKMSDMDQVIETIDNCIASKTASVTAFSPQSGFAVMENNNITALRRARAVLVEAQESNENWLDAGIQRISEQTAETAAATTPSR
ncbi:MAG: hypothetical protein ACYC69_02565 [Thermodesulfovibrionales bacterium]